MNIQSLVVVALRLISLNFLLEVAVLLIPQVLAYFRIYSNGPPYHSPPLMGLYFLLLAGLLAFAVILWFLAFPIARLVTRGVPKDLSLGALTLADCYSVAFIGVGLLYIAGSLPRFLVSAHFLLKMANPTSDSSWHEEFRWSDFSTIILSLIFGLALFVYGRRWALSLARRDAAGAAPADPTSDANT